MKTVQSLPENYAEIDKIDLQKNRTTAILVNLFALGISLAMLIPMLFLVPIYTLMEGDLPLVLLKLGVAMVAMIAYFVLHELVHGLFFRIFGGKRVKYGFTGLYAYAGCEAYFPRIPYLIIGLSPVVLWGAVIGVVQYFVPVSWFWVVYLIQIINVSGAAGDIFVTYKLLRYPPSVLVQDTGVSMTVYAPEK